MKTFRPLACALWCSGLLLPATGFAKEKMDDKAQIVALEHRLIESFKTRDVDGIMRNYIPGDDLFVFDVVVPRQYVGAAAYAKDWRDFIDAFPGPIAAEIEDLYVETGGTMAYSHWAVHYTMTDKDGKKLDLTARITDVYKKIKGEWLIVHEHTSYPVQFPAGVADLMSKK